MTKRQLSNPIKSNHPHSTTAIVNPKKKLKISSVLFQPLQASVMELEEDDKACITSDEDRSFIQSEDDIQSNDELEYYAQDSDTDGNHQVTKNLKKDHSENLDKETLPQAPNKSIGNQNDTIADQSIIKKENSTLETSNNSELNNNISATTFETLGVCEELCIACDSLGWKTPTEIQIQSIPFALQNRDIIGLAETGSGKTGSFAIPIIQKLLDLPDHRGVFALILAPTRELSVQIAEQFRALGATISLRVCTIVGGLDMAAQALELAKKPHVIVATPGRVVDHLQNTKGFNLGSIRFLVMDEADRLLSLDFEEPINNILAVIPKQRNTYLFSATMTSRVSKLQRASLVKPVKVEVCGKFDTAKNLVQSMKLIQHRDKWTYLVGLLLYFKSYSVMIFVNTCMDANRLAICLRKLGFESVCLHGKMSQPQRLGALNAFKSGRKKVLVATEVGSRGLDIPHVDVVINFDVPFNSKDYIHRVGRTARAGKSGRAVTLVTQYDIEAFQKIEHALNKRLDVFDDLHDDQWRSKSEDVSQARRLAEIEVKDQANSRNKGKGSRKRR